MPNRHHVYAFYPASTPGQWELDGTPCKSFDNEDDAILWAQDNYPDYFEGHYEWKACGLIVASNPEQAQQILNRFDADHGPSMP